jgi:hypothetical protein
LYRGSCYLEVVETKLLSKLVEPIFGWPFLTGGHCSEMAVDTGLTVFAIKIFYGI